MKIKFTKEISSNIKWLFIALCIGLLLYNNLRNFLFLNEKILSFSIMALVVITLTILYYFLLKRAILGLTPENRFFYIQT